MAILGCSKPNCWRGVFADKTAITTIFKRKNITEDIDTLYTDPGVEFKNATVKEFMNDRGINTRYTMVGRHGQMGVVEYYNHLITKTIGTKLTSEELEDDEEHNDWSEMLPKIVKVLNDKGNVRTPKISEFFKEPRTTAKELNDMLKVGTVVHVRLQQPKDHL